MTSPRLEIRLDRIRHNAEVLVARLAARGISVTGVTKATVGCPAVARELLAAGVGAIGESRIENIEALRGAGIDARMVLLRSPMLSQVDRVVEHADASLNSELVVIEALGTAAAAIGRCHEVVLTVELGDLREGLLPDDVDAVLDKTLSLVGVEVVGIGTNLACQSGASPDQRNMDELSALASAVEERHGLSLAVVSGGNSANLDWALDGHCDPGRINDLRLGEAILLGREPLHRQRVAGLRTDSFTLVAEVIESKLKPNQPWGTIAQTAFGDARSPAKTVGDVTGRALLAIGRQDVDPEALEPPPGTEILGASSDHLVLGTGTSLLGVGDEVRFDLGYSALLAAMTSPFVTKVTLAGDDPPPDIRSDP